MTSEFRSRLLAGNAAVGAWMFTSAIEVAEALASLRFDWLAVDFEHGAAGVREATAIFIAAERHGCVPFARLPNADPYLGRRLLDAGACGLIVPGVESAAAFQAFARHMVFPPAGRRGSSLGRFNRWGDDFDTYQHNFRPILVPMIETRAGVAAADDLASLPETDVLFLGPYDLSADLGHPGRFDQANYLAAISTVQAACRRHKKIAGIHQVIPDPIALRARVDEGYGFIAYCTDLLAARHALAGFKSALER